MNSREGSLSLFPAGLCIFLLVQLYDQKKRCDAGDRTWTSEDAAATGSERETNQPRRVFGCRLPIFRGTLSFSLILLFPQVFFYLPWTNEPLGADLVATRKSRLAYVVICTLLDTKRYDRFNEFRTVFPEILCSTSPVDGRNANVMAWITRVSYPDAILYLEIPRHNYSRSFSSYLRN